MEKKLTIDDVTYAISSVDNKTGKVFSLAGYDSPPTEQDFVQARMIVENNLRENNFDIQFTMRVSTAEEIEDYKKLIKQGSAYYEHHDPDEFRNKMN